MMTLMLTAAVALAQSAGAPVVEIENFIGEVRIEQGARLDARLERSGGAAADIRAQGGAVLVDGGQPMRRMRCHGRGEGQRVGVSRRDAVAFSELPLLIITTPDPAALRLHQSIVRAEAGELASLSLGLSQCGAFESGAIRGDADIAVSGSADVETGDVGGSLDAGVSGSGDLQLGAVGGAATVGVSGSGNVQMRDVDGALSVRVSGSGDVTASDVATLSARSSGSGDIEIGNAPGGIDYHSSGSGDLQVRVTSDVSVRASGSSAVRIAAMNGALDVNASGSGAVRIQDGEASRVSARVGGSGDVWFGGAAQTVDVRISGGGDVYVAEITGDRDIRTSGGGRFRSGR